MLIYKLLSVVVQDRQCQQVLTKFTLKLTGGLVFYHYLILIFLVARFIITGNINWNPDMEFMDHVFYFKLLLRN